MLLFGNKQEMSRILLSDRYVLRSDNSCERRNATVNRQYKKNGRNSSFYRKGKYDAETARMFMNWR